MKFEIKNAEELFPEGTRDFTIPWENIEQAYEGRINCCACGCSGDYYYTQHYCDYRLEFDGNDLLVSSDKKIARLLTEMQESEGVGWYRDDIGGGYILEIETKSYGPTYNKIKEGIRVYFKNSAFKNTKNK